MRDPNRIPIILARIAEAWKRQPDLRLGQLVYNATRYTVPDQFGIEDEALAASIEAQLPDPRDVESACGVPGCWECGDGQD